MLGYAIAPQESAQVWDELLQDLRSRGLKKVSLVTTDGIKGIEDVIRMNFPESRIQRCLVHIQRNITMRVRFKDRQEILDDFKKVYRCQTKEEANQALDEFERKWQGRYPKVVEIIERNDNLFTFLDYPEEIRGSIYSTNVIEGFNKQLKRKIKRKEQFPNEESLERFIVSLFESYNTKFSEHTHRGFGKVSIDIWNL